MANEAALADQMRTTFDFAADRAEVLRVSNLIESMVSHGNYPLGTSIHIRKSQRLLIAGAR